MQLTWAIYEPSERGLPFLVVLIRGARIRTVELALAAKTLTEAQELMRGKIEEGYPLKHPLVAQLERYAVGSGIKSNKKTRSKNSTAQASATRAGAEEE